MEAARGIYIKRQARHQWVLVDFDRGDPLLPVAWGTDIFRV